MPFWHCRARANNAASLHVSLNSLASSLVLRKNCRSVSNLEWSAFG